MTNSSTESVTLISIPAGASKQWLGATGTNFGDPANWSPSGVPTISDNVFIPAAAPNEPSLDVSRTIGALTIETGADLNVQGNILTLNGDLVADGTISRTSGHTTLAGTGVTARGDLGAIQSTGTVTLSGASTIQSNLQVTAAGDGKDPIDFYADDVILHGTAEHVVDQIAELEGEAGMSYLMAAPLSRRSFLLLTDKVLPRVAG